MTLPVMRLRLLGRFGVAAPDDVFMSIQLPTKKTGALLAYLGMSSDYTASREELAALLWGSGSDQQARQSLRQALASVRKDLRSPNVLSADNEVVRLQPGIWSVDALELEALADSPKLEDLECAVELFGGEFLSGFTI